VSRRQQPQQPKLPKTYIGGQIVPNSAAELDAYGKAMEGYAKELASYSEAIEGQGQGRSHFRAPKRCHQGGENGNYDSNPDYPVASAQNREFSKLPCLTSATPNGRTLPNSVLLTLQNSVLQTPQNLVLQTLPQPLNDEFLIEFASFNHPDQLSLIRRLDREQRDRRTSNSRCVDIAVFLRQVEIVDPVVGAPEAKKPALAKNGKPTVEVLTMFSSKENQLPLTSGDFDSVMGVAVAFIESLPKGKTYPEWNWASWCNKYRGQLAMASEGQAVLVTALFNSLEVPGVEFHLWRESELIVLTPVKVVLDKGFMLSWTDEKVMDGLFTRNPSLEGSYHEVSQVKDVVSKRHMVHFKADERLRASLAALQTGSSTFYLRLGGQDRRTIMARDPLVVAAEEAAELKGRTERALAKAIEASRPDLVREATLEQQQQQQQQREATPDHQRQQQQGNYTGDYTINKQNPNPDTFYNTGPSGETEFARVWKLMEVKREQLEREQQHQREQQHRLEQHQQQQLLQFQKDRQTLGPNNPDANAPGLQLPQVAQSDNERLLLQRGSTTGATTPIQQQLQQQQGTAISFSIIKYLTYNQDPSPQGVVKERVASFEVPSAVSPPQGVDMNLLATGLPPPADYESSDTDSNVTFELAENNKSTGSATVDNLEVRLGEEDMDDNEAPDS
jgi:hypothetical protein